MDEQKKAWGDLKRLGKSRRRQETGRSRNVSTRITELKYVLLSKKASREGYDNPGQYLAHLINRAIESELRR